MIWVLKGLKDKLIHLKTLNILEWFGPCLQGAYSLAKEITPGHKIPRIFMEEVVSVLELHCWRERGLYTTFWGLERA